MSIWQNKRTVGKQITEDNIAEIANSRDFFPAFIHRIDGVTLDYFVDITPIIFQVNRDSDIEIYEAIDTPVNAIFTDDIDLILYNFVTDAAAVKDENDESKLLEVFYQLRDKLLIKKH